MIDDLFHFHSPTAERESGADFTMPFMNLGSLNVHHRFGWNDNFCSIHFSHRNINLIPKTIETAAINVISQIHYLITPQIPSSNFNEDHLLLFAFVLRFSFMSPFSTDVWMSLGGAYFTVSICLFVLGRISPAEWDNPYPCIEEPTELENQFSFANAMWFCIGALLQQGSEIAPK